MNRAQEIFERIRKGGYAEVLRMVEEKEPEDLFLDYKIISTIYPAKLSDDDRKNFAKAISGFGNFEGGVIIWGVNCRKGKDSADVPSEIRTINNTSWFRTQLDNAISAMTLPAHSGVQNLGVSKEGDQGVVVTHVPPGTNVPIQGLALGAQNYFFRAGSSFLPVPHTMLASMFGRQPAPLLRVSFVPAIQMDQHSFRLEIQIWVENEGRGNAHDADVILDITNGRQLSISTNPIDEWEIRKRTPNRMTFLTGKRFTRLPPNDGVWAGVIMIPLNKSESIGHDLGITAICGTSNGPASPAALILKSQLLEEIRREFTGLSPEKDKRANAERILSAAKIGKS